MEDSKVLVQAKNQKPCTQPVSMKKLENFIEVKVGCSCEITTIASSQCFFNVGKNLANQWFLGKRPSWAEINLADKLFTWKTTESLPKWET